MKIGKKILSPLFAATLFFVYAQCYKNYDATNLTGEANFPIAIYHAFDERFEKITSNLNELKKLGFSHIQVSPIQQSNQETSDNRNIWWNAYQPVSYDIGGKYGDRDEFKQLLSAANTADLKIIVDVVFNHLGPVYKYSEAQENEEAHMRDGNDWQAAWGNTALLNAYLDQVIQKYKDIGFTKKSHFRDPPKWGFGGAGKDTPTLNLDNKEVLKIQTDFLDRLIAMGVAGFRFDAIGAFGSAWGHFNTHVKAKMVDIEGCFSYGEHASGNASSYKIFQSIGHDDKDFHTMDFVFYYQLGEAFPFGKKMAKLIKPNLNGDAWGAVTFAENHDTWAKRQLRPLKGGLPGWQGDSIDRILATAFILIRKGGVPLVFNETLNEGKEIIKNALKFRTIMRKQQAPVEYITVINNNAIKIERGNKGFAVINKAAESLNSFDVDLETYEFLPSEGLLACTGETNKVDIPGRTAVFFLNKLDD
jgi:alpha-amylase